MISYNVAGLLREGPGAIRDVRLRDRYVTLGTDVELAGPLDADLRLQRTNRGILVRGSVRAPLRRTCARCNEAFVEDVRVEISEEYLPSIDPDTGVPVQAEIAELAEDNTTLRIDEHHEVNLDSVFHDELALTEPMHALCRPDCPGLCVECGARLDSGDHAHGGDEIDPRMAGLAALLKGDSTDD